MATALPNNPHLECTICFESFDTPKILSCGHSFCLECLVRYIDGRKGTFPCPVCKQDVEIPQGGVDKFVTNFSLQTSTDSQKTTAISTIQPSTSLKPKHYCPNHSKKEVEYYCQTCYLGLCSKCILKDHKDHKILDLECDSTREKVVQELSKSEQIIQNKIEALEKHHTTLLETSDKLIFFCDEACTKLGEETEKIIGELKESCEKRQQEIRDNFDKNESKLTEARQKVITQITNIKTDLDTSRPTTEEPSLTLIYSLTKLKDLQKLCENMKTDIPPVTYVGWREGSVKVCDILGSTVTKLLSGSIVPMSIDPESLFETMMAFGLNSFNFSKRPHQSSESNVFRFNYVDIDMDDDIEGCVSDDKSPGLVWSCAVRGSDNGCFKMYIQLQQKDNPLVESCKIKYTVTILNEDEDKNMIGKTMTGKFAPGHSRFGIEIEEDELNRSEGFIDGDGYGEFLVKLDILKVINVTYK